MFRTRAARVQNYSRRIATTAQYFPMEQELASLHCEMCGNNHGRRTRPTAFRTLRSSRNLAGRVLFRRAHSGKQLSLHGFFDAVDSGRWNGQPSCRGCTNGHDDANRPPPHRDYFARIARGPSRHSRIETKSAAGVRSLRGLCMSHKRCHRQPSLAVQTRGKVERRLVFPILNFGKVRLSTANCFG